MAIPKHKKVGDNVKHWKILLYADSGAGKTVFALKGKRVLALSIGAEIEGLMSAARLGTDAESIEAKTWDELIAMNLDLWSDEGKAWLAENFDVLVVDSLTEADSQCMSYILRATRAQKLAKDTDPDKPWVDDYGMRNILLEKLVRTINDLPINVFWTALPRTGEDPDGKEFMVPMIGGNKATDYRFSMKLAALMTTFGYMRVETVNVPAPTEEKPDATKKVKQRVIYWDDTSFSKGKDRTTVLTPKTINFTMAHMQACIAGRINNEGKKIGGPIAPAAKSAPRPIQKAAPPKAEPKPEPTPEPEPEKNSEVVDTGTPNNVIAMGKAESEPEQTSPVAPAEVQSDDATEGADDDSVDLASVEP